MENVSKTLYIPLYGKALVSRKGILLHDPMAEKIWEAEGFPLKGKSASKWLAYYMSMRAVVFDRWVREKAAAHPGAAVLHLGCGMDSRNLRTNVENSWYDVDFPDVIRQRRAYFPERENYHMLGYDLRQDGWLAGIGAQSAAIVVMEGISMYLTPEELTQLVSRITARFARVYLLMDCYSVFAAKASRFKNPINDVGVHTVTGMDSPDIPGISFLRELDMTPEALIRQLPGGEQRLFRKLYAGKFARGLYHLYEYDTGA